MEGVLEELDGVDAEHVVRALGRFGLGLDVLDGHVVFRANNKTLWVRAASIVAPTSPRPDARGVPFLHTTMAAPKLTTAAVMWLGGAARAHVVELGRGEAAAYMSRERVELAAGRVAGAERTGYVVVRHEGVTLGLGLWRAAEVDGDGVLDSYFPKWLANAPGVSAFGDAT
jgi:NOL1/NOP2/fmu family ribosome biogenesis protein